MQGAKAMPKVQHPQTPRNMENPIGQTQQIGKAKRIVYKRLDRVQKWLLDEFKAIPVQASNERRYTYLIDLTWLQRIVQELKNRLGDGEAGAVADIAMTSYRRGVGMASVNLAKISDDYTRSVTEALLRDEVRKRAALVGARVFEQMQGFAGETGADLARVLMSAVENFTNPRRVAKTIRERFGVAKSRADRIARTEITGALRRGRLDEASDAEATFGVTVKMIWFSALLPTTRFTHARRHGKLYTPGEVRDFYERDGNAINCRCSQTEAVLGKDGRPLSKKLLERLAEQRKKFSPSEAA